MRSKDIIDKVKAICNVYHKYHNVTTHPLAKTCSLLISILGKQNKRKKREKGDGEGGPEEGDWERKGWREGETEEGTD